jgi:hypothetical protein
MRFLHIALCPETPLLLIEPPFVGSETSEGVIVSHCSREN